MTRTKIILLTALLSTSAFGADLPVKPKAAVPVACTPTYCSGWYIGGHLEGAGPISSGSADLTNGAGLGAHIGYQLWNGSWFWAAEVGGSGYFGASTFVSSGNAVTVRPYSVDYVTKVGYGLKDFFNTGGVTAPSQGLFTNFNASMVSPYAVVGGRTRNIGTGFLAGAGFEFAIGNGWNAFAEAFHVNYNTTMNLVPIGSENVARGGVNYMF